MCLNHFIQNLPQRSSWLALWSAHLPGSAGGSGHWTGCQGSGFSSSFQLACCSQAQQHLWSRRILQGQHHPFLPPPCPHPAPREVRKWAGCSHTGGETWAPAPAAGPTHPCSWEPEKQPGGPLLPLAADRSQGLQRTCVSFGVGETQVQIQLYHETIPWPQVNCLAQAPPFATLK